MKDKKLLSAQDLENLLSNRFCPPAWAFIPQVRNGTGYVKTVTTVDAIAMGLYPSRGLYLNGFEIKVNRGDWLKELKKPDKAEEIAQFCDFFWVVSPKDIIKIEEIPSNWGWMIPFGKTTKVIKPAKQLKSQPIDNLFLAAILRRTQEIIIPDAKLNEVKKEGIDIGRERADQDFKYEKEEHIRLQEKVSDFEKRSGVTINSWRAGNVGDAVKMVLNGEHLRIKQSLERLHQQARDIANEIAEELNKGKT